MPKRTKPKAKPRASPLAADLAEYKALVLLGANLFYAGMKQASPQAAAGVPEFTFAKREKAEKKGDPLPEV